MIKLSCEQFKEMLIERHGEAVYEKLKAATVGIAGLGGLGSNVAVALVRVGVGKLVIADFDIVEPSNLNRQNYFVAQLGADKVNATIENLKKINPYVEIKGVSVKLNPENVPAVFKDCPIVAECFDKAQSKQMLIETILGSMKKTIVVAASGLAGYGKSNEIRTKKISERLIMVGDSENGIEKGLSLMACRVIIAAGHQANAIVELLINSF
ncbi:MAG: sulfur carrier protein ThiS adenylyltransferase ThiF [Phycisphaerae bacterium]|nr:sulfur carrier protein ThiS adenylyltransferase ThiF [Phycisphaerae bacterium]